MKQCARCGTLITEATWRSWPTVGERYYQADSEGGVLVLQRLEEKRCTCGAIIRDDLPPLEGCFDCRAVPATQHGLCDDCAGSGRWVEDELEAGGKGWFRR